MNIVTLLVGKTEPEQEREIEKFLNEDANNRSFYKGFYEAACKSLDKHRNVAQARNQLDSEGWAIQEGCFSILFKIASYSVCKKMITPNQYLNISSETRTQMNRAHYSSRIRVSKKQRA